MQCSTCAWHSQLMMHSQIFQGNRKGENHHLLSKYHLFLFSSNFSKRQCQVNLKPSKLKAVNLNLPNACKTNIKPAKIVYYNSQIYCFRYMERRSLRVQVYGTNNSVVQLQNPIVGYIWSTRVPMSGGMIKSVGQ